MDDHLEPLAENAGGRQVFAAEAIVEEGGRSVGPDSYRTGRDFAQVEHNTVDIARSAVDIGIDEL